MPSRRRSPAAAEPSSRMATARVEPAPAKVNLTLRVLGRRADGYHDPRKPRGLCGRRRPPGRSCRAPRWRSTCAARPPRPPATLDGNLVLKAARALGRTRSRSSGSAGLTLSKRLPVAAGLGGGSSDAAAALRLLARANRLALDDPRLMEAARVTGADVPVCLDPRPRVMRGIGDILSEPLDLPRLPAVLVNPGVAVPTKDVFAALAASFTSPACGGGRRPKQAGRGHTKRLARVRRLPSPTAREGRGATEFVAALADDRNDLEAPAIDASAGDRRCPLRASAIPGLPARADVGLGRHLLRSVRFRPRGCRRGAGAARGVVRRGGCGRRRWAAAT